MADFFQTRRAYALTAAALVALLLVPFFVVDVPPVLDYPNHLARLYVLAFGADDPFLSRMYEPAWRVLPNLAVDLIGPGLMRVFGVEFAGKALLAGALLLPAAGAVAYNRVAFGKFSYWSLAAGLVAFNGIFFLGFMNFLLGVGVAFFGAAFWMFMRPRILLSAALGIAAFAIACFFCHLIAALLLGLLIGAHELGDVWARRKEDGLRWPVLALRVLVLALAFAPLALLYSLGMSSTAGAPWVGNSFEVKVNGLFAPFMVYDKTIGLATGAAVLLALVLMSRRWRYHPGAVVALVVLAPVYVVAPQIMHGGSFVDVRVTLMMALLLFAGAQPDFPRRVGWAVAGIAAALILVRTTHVTTVWSAHRAELADFRRVVRDVEPGARVLAAQVRVDKTVYAAGEPASRRIPNLYRTDLHLPALLLLEHRAFWPLLFANPHQQPLRVSDAYRPLAMPLGEATDVRYLQMDEPPARALMYAPYLAHRWTEFDYVLVLRAGALGDPATLRPDKLTLVSSSDIAALYRVRR